MKAFYPKLFIDVEDPSKMITNHKENPWDYRPCKLSVITKSENMMTENLVNDGVDLQLKRAIEIKNKNHLKTDFVVFNTSIQK